MSRKHFTTENLRPLEALSWFIYRYCPISLSQGLGYAERDEHSVGGSDHWYTDQLLRLRGYGIMPTTERERPIFHVNRSTMYDRVGPAEPGSFDGPKQLSQLPCTPLNRAILYVNLLAVLRGYDSKHPANLTTDPKTKLQLYVWLPRTKAELLAPPLNTAKYPPKHLQELKAHETGAAPLLVPTWTGLCEEWLDYARRHPDYCVDKLGYGHRQYLASHGQPNRTLHLQAAP